MTIYEETWSKRGVETGIKKNCPLVGVNLKGLRMGIMIKGEERGINSKGDDFIFDS